MYVEGCYCQSVASMRFPRIRDEQITTGTENGRHGALIIVRTTHAAEDKRRERGGGGDGHKTRKQIRNRIATLSRTPWKKKKKKGSEEEEKKVAIQSLPTHNALSSTQLKVVVVVKGWAAGVLQQMVPLGLLPYGTLAVATVAPMTRRN